MTVFEKGGDELAAMWAGIEQNGQDEIGSLALEKSLPGVARLSVGLASSLAESSQIASIPPASKVKRMPPHRQVPEQCLCFTGPRRVANFFVVFFCIAFER